MKAGIYIVFIIAVFFSCSLSAENRINRHLSILQHLMENNLAYDSIAPIDSVISWGQQVCPILEQKGEMDLFFNMRQLMVHLYSVRGDIGQAIDEARQMYEKAELMKHPLGIALSSRAIGDAYYCSNMAPEAISAYKEAINYSAPSSSNIYYTEMTILQLISVLMEEGEIEEAGIYRSRLLQSEYIHTNKTLQLYTLATDVIYYIKRNDLATAHECLLKALQFYESDKQPFYYPLICYMQGQYYGATDQYQLALQYYDDFLKNIPHKTRSINYLQATYAKADLFIKMNNPKEAAKLYEEISDITDSVVAPSYAHRINSLRASYQENRMKVENKTELNHILLGSLFIGFIVLIVIVYLALHIKRQNKKITESKIRLEQSRQNAENAVRTKSLFLSNMSHEIRTPLTALSGFSNLLTEQNIDSEMRRQCGEIIQQNSDLLLKLINDVIDLSNLGAGNMQFNFAYHDTIVICHNVIDTVNKVKQTQAEVVFKTSLHTLKLYTDESRLQQLLINLLINATKFTPQGSITLEIQLQSETTALFSVTDTGCGIPLDRQSKIFTRFEKLNENAQGTGLGLSICQLITERIGGKIWIDPTYTDGCRFYFTHPVNLEEKEKEAQA